jgi:broad specificity phosphatase PhoE
MKKEWPQFDWSTVDPVYPAKTGLYEFSKRGLRERGIAARKWLRNRPEKVIAVVSHSGFMRIGVSYKNYNNADFRIFDFAEGFEKVGGKLVEWELTEANGGGK